MQLDQTQHAGPDLELLVELPSWRRSFLDNLRDTVAPKNLPPLDIRSAPSAFWPDVFVQHILPWNGFAQSGLTHVAAIALLIMLTRLFALQPRAELRPTFQHSQVIYYSPSEYLPPLDTRATEDGQRKKADPELSKQTIISVPPEHESGAQTIVTPPKVRLKQDVALPNIVAWSDKVQKPQLAIPASPVIAAAEIQRLAPEMNSVVAPPPRDVERATLSTSTTLPGPNAAVIAPPPSVESASRLRGELNVGPSAVIAPATSLPVAEQHAMPGGRTLTAAQQVVPPPPSVGSGTGGASFGAPGRIIALNLHPAVGAPPDPPAGNRRGSFAATPEGHVGASGEAGSSPGTGTGSAGRGNAHASNLPTGLYVGSAGKPAAVAGDPSGKASSNTVNPNLTATLPPTGAAKPLTADSATRLSEPERAIFGGRKFYSVSLSMPNLNSAGGSWVIRFAELDHSTSASTPGKSPSDLSQPMATHKVDPAYPLQLMKENVAGTVILYAIIRADGTVADVRILRGVDDRLDHFASEAVSKWKFQPATKAGVPIDVEATFRIPFRPAINF